MSISQSLTLINEVPQVFKELWAFFSLAQQIQTNYAELFEEPDFGFEDQTLREPAQSHFFRVDEKTIQFRFENKISIAFANNEDSALLSFFLSLTFSLIHLVS